MVHETFCTRYQRRQQNYDSSESFRAKCPFRETNCVGKHCRSQVNHSDTKLFPSHGLACKTQEQSHIYCQLCAETEAAHVQTQVKLPPDLHPSHIIASKNATSCVREITRSLLLLFYYHVIFDDQMDLGFNKTRNLLFCVIKA